MDVQQVLRGTLSPDQAVRSAAEQQLAQAAENDFSQYLTTLASALSSNDAPTDVRMGAGLALKNSFSARDYARLREIQQRWVQGVNPDVKRQIKEITLVTLASDDARAGAAAGQFVAAIAAIEIPRNEWPELMPKLVENVGQGSDHLKQASLTTIGFICETEDTHLREALSGHSNSILTAVVQGARKEEANIEVRNSAITALSDSLEFVRSNFENEGERNYIMQVVCEATQANDTRIQAGAFGCLNRIMGLYYEKMKFYMERALYGLTVIGMKNEDEDVAKLAVEFWCTVCEEEIAIEDDNLAAKDEGSSEQRPHYSFARVAANEVVPTLLFLLTKQDEDAPDDEYNISRAAYQCLNLFAQAIGGQVIDLVLQFVEQNLNDEDWHKRDAAVSAFGAIMDGPDESVLTALAKQALPLLMDKMKDSNVHVRDSAAYALGRVCEVAHQAINVDQQLSDIISLLFEGIKSNPRMATSCCWALMSIAENFAGEPGCQTNPLSSRFQESCQFLLAATEKPDPNNTQLLIAAYEVLSTWVTNAAGDQVGTVRELSRVILERLNGAIQMQSQVVSVEDRLILEEMQTSLVRVVLQIIQRLEAESGQISNDIMHVLLNLLQTISGKSSVPEDVFAAISALANSLEENFLPYMEAFKPFLYSALKNFESEPALCTMAIGLTGDIVRALGEKSRPFCDDIMNLLLEDLKANNFDNRNKPAILQCFGDIAQSIGPHFETYLEVVGNVLQVAANMQVASDMYEQLEYIIQLRESIMDAWSGTIQAMKQGKAQALQAYVEPITQLIAIVAQDALGHRSEPLLRSTMGVIGDLADTFPQGEYANFFRQEWVTVLIKEVRLNREFSDRTRETARWAKEQVKRQISIASQAQTQQMS